MKYTKPTYRPKPTKPVKKTKGRKSKASAEEDEKRRNADELAEGWGNNLLKIFRT